MSKTTNPSDRHRLLLVSDASGNLIEHTISALITQFPPHSFEIQSLPFMRSRETVAEAFAPFEKAIVCHAVASAELKQVIAEACAFRGWPCHDITGPTLAFLSSAAELETCPSLGAVHHLDASYMGRMAAVEFAMQHDDNRRMDRLSEAEIILVGVSRVSKSPNALFLAYRGFKVANVAIVPSEGLPPPLKRHRKKNVVALSIQPRRLAEIRARRFSSWRLADDFNYEDLREVIHEVRDAEELFSAKGWPIIDTTDLAVEETSAKVLQALKMQPKMMT